jgi:hypothetical protein
MRSQVCPDECKHTLGKVNQKDRQGYTAGPLKKEKEKRDMCSGGVVFSSIHLKHQGCIKDPCSITVQLQFNYSSITVQLQFNYSSITVQLRKRLTVAVTAC